jgi:uncharacterized membrane protein
MVGTGKGAQNGILIKGGEAQVYKIIADENGMVFQNKIIEKTGFTKVKVSRILDTLEHKGLLERRRRGMSNVVVLR